MNNMLRGEIYAINKDFHLPYKHLYLKQFRTRKFMIVLVKQLKSDMPDLNITLSETEDEYILRMER